MKRKGLQILNHCGRVANAPERGEISRAYFVSDATKHSLAATGVFERD